MGGCRPSLEATKQLPVVYHEAVIEYEGGIAREQAAIESISDNMVPLSRVPEFCRAFCDEEMLFTGYEALLCCTNLRAECPDDEVEMRDDAMATMDANLRPYCGRALANPEKCPCTHWRSDCSAAPPLRRAVEAGAPRAVGRARQHGGRRRPGALRTMARVRGNWLRCRCASPIPT